VTLREEIDRTWRDAIRLRGELGMGTVIRMRRELLDIHDGRPTIADPAAYLVRARSLMMELADEADATGLAADAAVYAAAVDAVRKLEERRRTEREGETG
jgi:hypothetical protein